jgi:(R)-2-hydroxyacyl-CoA dehydratese activating ATPase
LIGFLEKQTGRKLDRERLWETMRLAGLDIGSTMTKAVIIDGEGKVLGSVIGPTGAQHRHLALQVMAEVLDKTGLVLEALDFIVATGYGRINVPFADKQITEITCHARGTHAFFPSPRTVIDIRGQFTKAVRLTPQGRVADFLISEKCATGSGRFLQVMARILHIKWEAIGPLSLKSEKPVEFSTNCAVFAESETISRLAEGARPEDLLAGLHRAMAAKVAMLVRRLKMEPEVVLTGGGAEDAGLVRAVSEALGLPVRVPENPRLTAALGAVCLAEENQF